MNETVGQNVSLGDSAENLLLECRYSHEKCMITSLVDMENVPAFFLAHYLEFKRPRNHFKSSNRSVFPQSASLGRRRRAANQRRSSSPETASSSPCRSNMAAHRQCRLSRWKWPCYCVTQLSAISFQRFLNCFERWKNLDGMENKITAQVSLPHVTNRLRNQGCVQFASGLLLLAIAFQTRRSVSTPLLRYGNKMATLYFEHRKTQIETWMGTWTCSLAVLWLWIWQIVWHLVPSAHVHRRLRWFIWSVCLSGI